MALCPFASWNSTGATPGGAIVPRVIILHVTAGTGDARPHDGLEWHFEIFKDGRIQQQVDTVALASANYKANGFAISIETEGLGDGTWTDAQLKSIERLINWLLAVHPTIRRQICPTWDGSGIGYHIQFGSPGYWTPVAKSCPGPNRIRQFKEVLMPRILAGTSPAPIPAPLEDDDMQPYFFVQAPGNAAVYLVPADQTEKRHIPNEAALAKHQQFLALGNPAWNRGIVLMADAEWMAWFNSLPLHGAVIAPAVDVDEAALATALAPLLKVGATPQEIAKAVIAEIAS